MTVRGTQYVRQYVPELFPTVCSCTADVFALFILGINLSTSLPPATLHCISNLACTHRAPGYVNNHKVAGAFVSDIFNFGQAQCLSGTFWACCRRQGFGTSSGKCAWQPYFHLFQVTLHPI